MKPEELLDPDFQGFLMPGTQTWSLDTLADIRNRVHAGFKPANELRCEQRWIPGCDGQKLRLCLYRPSSSPESKLPAIVYLHGGGFVLGRPEMADDYLADLAEQVQAIIVAVDYRLAPEFPFPAPLDDCYSALAWLHSNQQSLGVDAKRLVIMGHSAGGGLAAALAMLVRDREQYVLAGQVLIYPMLDHRTGTESSPHTNCTTGVIGWSAHPNQFCWSCLRPDHPLSQASAGLYSPALQTNLANLPRTFLSVGALDLFLEEGVAFATRLSRSGVPIELHVYPGAPHMFDQHPGRITDQSRLDIARALKTMISEGASSGI
ncbi:alpha/beta hydrolase [Pseudomonas sp. S2_C03]